MATKPEKQHPEIRGDRNPLTSRKLKQRLRQNRFVPKRLEKSMAPKNGTDIDLPPGSKPDISAPGNKPDIPAQQPPQQPAPGEPVPLR